MPLYFGHKNAKGLAVSPALQSLGVDMLRAAPSSVGIIARPLVTQPGYASYVNHLPAFMKAYNEQKTIPLDRQGYPASLSMDQCINIGNPPLVVDFGGPVPSGHIDTLNDIGFERIKVQRTDNIIRFPAVTINQVRKIRNMNPSVTTPAPVNTVNLSAFDSWVLVVRVLSNLLLAHTYPAFRDDEHLIEEIDSLTEDIKRKVHPVSESSISKRQKGASGKARTVGEEDEDMDDDDDAIPTEPAADVILNRAKPSSKQYAGWGTPSDLPNASGLFFPFLPELCTYDTTTVPSLIEDYLFQSLGDTPERQMDRMEKIRSAWGIIGKTDAGNVAAHLSKVILLSLKSQARAFPFVIDGVYQGCVLSGSRLFVGLHGKVHRPLPYDKLQEETGTYHMHSIVLDQIKVLCDAEWNKEPTTMRELREELLSESISEEDRDQIRKLAVHLHFRGERFLAVNAQTLMAIIRDIASPEALENTKLPMHHSALFSRDKVYVSLSAFGYQAPSFMIENCPRVPLVSSKAPTTLVMRQKPLDIATMDWKNMLESKEMRNNPRNLSRANRDRSVVGNDKVVLWGELNKMATSVGGKSKDASGVVEEETGGISLDDGLDSW